MKSLKWKGLTVTGETITPHIANEMLMRNLKNRDRNNGNLNFIKNHLLKDDFIITGDTIKISKSGRLLDGQHRLVSVVETGKSINTLVVRGIDDDAFSYMDINKVRNMGDILSIVGIQNSDKIAAMIRFIVHYNGSGLLAASHTGIDNYKMSNEEGRQFAEKNSASLVQSYNQGFNKKNRIISKPKLAGFHYVIKTKNIKKADEFCSRLCDGLFLKEDSPIYVLRQRLLTDLNANRRMKMPERFALLAKAWNLFVQDKTTTKLTFNRDKEKYPTLF